MWKQLISGIVAGSLIALPAWADHRGERFDRGQGRVDYARVIKVEPVTREVRRQVPERSCWEEQVRVERPRDRYASATPVIIGGIIGAAIGNSLGHSHHKTNRDLKTLAGGLLGASIGGDIARREAHARGVDVDYRTEQRCEVSYHTEVSERVVGYEVTYRYKGETFRTRMDYDPGDKIKVKVNVRPVM